MRTTFIDTLCELAAEDERIWLLNGDLGYSVLERFTTRFPRRSVNVGVAEQNMTGVAAGLALCGKIVFTYSIGNFPTLRCLEQIRNDVCYHNLNVKIVAVGGGLAYGAQGYTHHAIEDLAIMRALPHMTVLAPGDPVETRAATRALVDWRGPCYLRLGKAGEPVVHRTDFDFQIGKAILLREGRDVTMVSTGGMLKNVVEAAQLLADAGISARVLSMPTVKPLDEQAIEDASRETRLLCVVEEHSETGGLADAVARCLATNPARNCRLVPMNIPASGGNNSLGSQAYLIAQAGLSPSDISRRLIELLPR
jgi:transketolase